MTILPNPDGPVSHRSALWVTVAVDVRDSVTVTVPSGERFSPEFPTLRLPTGVRLAVHLFTDHDDASTWWAELSAAAMTAAGWHAERARRQR